MKTAKEYKDSLRDRKIKVYLKGELLDPKTLICLLYTSDAADD